MVTTNPAQPYVVILVLNWNLPAQTIACVDSLLAGDYPHQRVVVIDNGSTDDSLALLRGHFGSRDHPSGDRLQFLLCEGQ